MWLRDCLHMLMREDVERLSGESLFTYADEGRCG